ncbi:MAG: tRNA uridine-5-carboxymethylaminomethyl(34) synthesis GTPase MnmE [Flavobacteriales bacterium]
MTHSIQDTIVALATANGLGAIAVIRLSGNQSLAIADAVFKPIKGKKKVSQKSTHSITLGELKNDEVVLDQVLCSIFKNPQSYTGEDVVEFSCHGSVFIQQQVIQLLIKQGARLANPGEFTMRAYLNGKMDLAQAESVADLISSNSSASHQTAIQQMRGGFSSDLKDLRAQLIHFAAMLELELDFSQEDVEFANRDELKTLLNTLENALKYLSDSFALGQVIKEGIPVAIVGEPNVGKSTLLNALLNEERAIVSDIEGTTRDSIEDELILDGINYRFIDTAGIRKTEDSIEQIGIKKTFEKIEQSRVVLYMMDAQKLETKQADYVNEFKSISDQHTDKLCIPILNKSDQLVDDIPKIINELIYLTSISAKEKQGLSDLVDILTSVVQSGALSNNKTIVTNSRHFEALNNSLYFIRQTKMGLADGVPSDLLATDIRQAISHLGSITGAVDIDSDILGTIFGKFCIGK